MYCKNCGKEIKEDHIFCVGCGVKINDVNESEEISPLGFSESMENAEEDMVSKKTVKRKRPLVTVFLVVLIPLLLVGGYIGIKYLKNSDGGSLFGEKQFFVSSERALTEEGNVIYEIKYKYDSNGKEISRAAYDGNGNEDKSYLKYAYDQQWEILEVYWKIEIDDEEPATAYFKQHPDYFFTYDSKGKLIKWDYLKENELGIYVVEYSYTSKIVRTKVK